MDKKRYSGRIENLRVALMDNVEEDIADEFISAAKGGSLLREIDKARPRELVLIARKRDYDLETILHLLRMYETAEIILTYPKEPWIISDFRGWST